MLPNNSSLSRGKSTHNKGITLAQAAEKDYIYICNVLKSPIIPKLDAAEEFILEKLLNNSKSTLIDLNICIFPNISL